MVKYIKYEIELWIFFTLKHFESREKVEKAKKKILNEHTAFLKITNFGKRSTFKS